MSPCSRIVPTHYRWTHARIFTLHSLDKTVTTSYQVNLISQSFIFIFFFSRQSRSFNFFICTVHIWVRVARQCYFVSYLFTFYLALFGGIRIKFGLLFNYFAHLWRISRNWIKSLICRYLRLQCNIIQPQLRKPHRPINLNPQLNRTTISESNFPHINGVGVNWLNCLSFYRPCVFSHKNNISN